MTTSIISQHSSYDCISTGELDGKKNLKLFIKLTYCISTIIFKCLPVSGDVDFTDNIEKKRLLNPRTL